MFFFIFGKENKNLIKDRGNHKNGK